MKTIVSLFSSAGVGDYGFKMEGFETIATNELIQERIDIQKLNKKCKYDTGYINYDIKEESTKQLIMDEIAFWENKHKISIVDVVLATPPCQGMSTANFKKNNETPRNSLVIESLKLIKKIKPRYFVLENVKSFLKTMCQDVDKRFKTIEEAIDSNFAADYNIHSQIINFMDYGIPSSRPRTIVIGTRKDHTNLSPLLVFPSKTKKIPLMKSIGKLKSLNKFNEYYSSDPLHMFRKYPSYMRKWISDLEEGQDAFNFSKVKPYKIVNNKKIPLKGKYLGNKFSRMFWNKPAPAIHTRSDQLASNRTIHPSDDRVLSIRELMNVMTIPRKFVWFKKDEYEKAQNKIQFLRKKELNIRRSIGEAVPTAIFREIAKNIKNVDKDPFETLYRMQYDDNRMENNSSFYTPQSVIFNVLKNINTSKKQIKILEPSAGWGSFLPQIIKKFQHLEKVDITLMDIDEEAINKGKELFKNIFIPKNMNIIWKVGNFLEDDIPKFDITLGNPPYKKIGNRNLFHMFLKKSTEISDLISFIVPKTIINSDSDMSLRNKIIEKYHVNSLIEFGVRTFKGVNIETIVITASKNKKSNYTNISRYYEQPKYMKSTYIFLNKIWLPYRDKKFDELFNRMELDIFKSFRDRQITNKFLNESGKGIWILRSKNLLKGKVEYISGYDRHSENISQFNSSKFLNKKIIIVPNFTYKMRAAMLPKNVLGNGSIVYMIKKNKNFDDFKKVIKLYNSDEFNHYYSVLQSYSKFTINVNKTITYFMGVIKDA